MSDRDSDVSPGTCAVKTPGPALRLMAASANCRRSTGQRCFLNAAADSPFPPIDQMDLACRRTLREYFFACRVSPDVHHCECGSYQLIPVKISTHTYCFISTTRWTLL